VHPGRKNDIAGLEIVEILKEAGANMSRVIMCHIDNRVRGHAARCQIAKSGCYLEYDVFGWSSFLPVSLYRDSGIDLPTDSQRIYEIMDLIREGYLEQVIVSQDICFKTWRARYGGRGYAHISNYIIPLMLSKGMSQEQIDKIMVENPKRILTFV
jgi:phosphotriesterase-related protein